MTAQDTPKFTGTQMYRDPLGRFFYWYASDWATFEMKEVVPKTRGKKSKARLTAAKRATEEQPLPVREGFGAAPDPDDPHTSISVWVSPLAEAVVAEDLEELRQGVDDGLAALEDCRVEESSDDVLSNLVKFNRIYEFTENGQRRKRKQWVMYVDTWLMCVTWQGSSPEAYKHWLALANYSFNTFQIPEALWFATDRDLTGKAKAAAAAEATNGAEERG
jgi:hypothetical protein